MFYFSGRVPYLLDYRNMMLATVGLYYNEKIDCTCRQPMLVLIFLKVKFQKLQFFF